MKRNTMIIGTEKVLDGGYYDLVKQNNFRKENNIGIWVHLRAALNEPLLTLFYQAIPPVN